MIFKYEQGGATNLPFVNYLPVIISDKRTTATLEEALAAKATKLSESGQLTSKDLYTMLKEKLKGLPSDVNVAMLQLGDLELMAQMDFDGSLTLNLESKYLSILGTMNNLTFSRELYDDAMKTAKENGGLNEAAINLYGLVYMTNGKEYKMMSPEEAKLSGWIPVTNLDLLYMRANDASMSGNDKIYNIVNNSIGIELVTKMILDSISKLGTTNNKEEAYALTEQGLLLQGLESFIKASLESGQYDASIEDLYKGSIITKTLAELAQQALTWIYKTLPNNAKALLKMRTNDGSDKEAVGLISLLINSTTSNSREFSLSLEEGPTKNSGKNSNNKDGKDDTKLQTSFPLEIMNRTGEVDLSPITIDKGDGTLMSVMGSFYSAIPDKKGETIVNTSLLNMLAQSGILDIVKNMKNITFGDQKLSPQLLANVTYNNTGIVRVNLPKNEDGTVNLHVLDDFNAATAEIKALHNPTPQLIYTIKVKYHLDKYLDDNGEPNPQYTAPFLVTEGYTTERNNILDSLFVKEINATDEDILLIKDSLTTGTGKDKKEPDIDTNEWWNPFDWFGNYDKVYKAAIYIPITNNVNAAVRGANLKLDYDESLKLELKYRNFERMSLAKTTSADVLG